MIARAPAAHGDWRDVGIVTTGCALAAAAAVGAAFSTVLVLVGLAVAAVLGLCAWKPVAATYLYLGTLPFIAGMERGIIPLVRPNEALLAIVLAGAVMGGYLRLLAGVGVPLRLRPAIDVPLVAFALLCTVWPIASLLVRGAAPTGSEIAAILPACKLLALFLLVRMTVTTPARLVNCIRLVIWPAAAIAVIAVLQTRGVPPVVSLLQAYTPDESVDELTARGSTTLGSSIATGDYVIIALVLLVMAGARGVIGRREGLAAGFLLGAGTLAAGQFSTWISAVIVAILILAVTPELRRPALRFLPVAGVAVLLGAPALMSRLAGFGEGYGVPRSWLGRWDNLTTFYVPPLFDEGGFVIGVSPNAVLRAPETWRETIYLESGYLQFLWVGGIPLLLGFAWLTVAVVRRTGELSGRRDALGSVASTLRIVWIAVAILSVIDPHLFLRGTGDLLFLLLALVAGSLDRFPDRGSAGRGAGVGLAVPRAGPGSG